MNIACRLCSVLAPALLAAYAPAVLADAFYCGPNTIREGMPSAEIEDKCGAPAKIKVIEEPVFTRRPTGEVIQTGVETTYLWYFDRGRNQFVAEITVQDAVAKKIRLLHTRNIDDVPDE